MKDALSEAVGDRLNDATLDKVGVKRGEGGAEDRLAAGLKLQKRLVAIIEGQPPLDVFVRWKPISEQPIGWEPDINDDVRLNIRPSWLRTFPAAKHALGFSGETQHQLEQGPG